jgi:hypothetical protein
MLLNTKRYALVLIAICFTAFLTIVSANVLIDPQRVFGTNLFPDKLNENLRFRQYLAYRKTEDLTGGLMFASSRGGGIPLDVLSAQTGATFANFTVAAGLITDHLPVLERAIADKAARGERLKQVFLLLDVDLFGERPSTNRNPQTQLHPDLTGEDPVRFWIRYLTAIQFRAWRDDVCRAVRGADQNTTPRTPSFAICRPAAGPAPLPAPTGTMRPTSRPDYQRQLVLLRRFVELCNRQGINLTVATSPMNQWVLRYYDRQDLALVVTDLSRITPTWDFGAPAWLSERKDLWTDYSHFTKEAGRMMIERIFTGRLPDGGLPFGERRPPADPSAAGS